MGRSMSVAPAEPINKQPIRQTMPIFLRLKAIIHTVMKLQMYGIFQEETVSLGDF